MHIWPLFAAIAAVSPASSPILWQNVSVGMSVVQVRGAQPEAVEPSDHPTLKGGAACLLNLPKFEIAADDYRVCFFFRDGKLIQVSLNALGEPTEAQFRNIVTALRAKYGPELTLAPSSIGYDADWATKNGVNVSVLFLNKFGNLLNINYQVRLAEDTKRL